MKHIEIFDTTLRDGAQSAEINFSLKDKISILALLDDMGIDYAECGNVCASPVDKQLFEYFHDHKPSYHSLKPVAFMTTCRDGLVVEEDERITTSVELALEYVSLIGKASAYHVKNVLNITKESNLSLIDKTVRYAVGKGKKVIFCAEHFFDGCRDDEKYAFSVLKCAHDAGAETLVLCDTNGGSVMSCIEKYTKKASKLFPRIGIHCHNDSGLAVANSLEAVNSGAIQVHGTFCGIGERCGNTDLCVLIPDLRLKLGFGVIEEDKLMLLSSTARAIADLANITFNERTPYVGRYAFSHKAGMHIDGFLKLNDSFEHVDPSKTGNRRQLLISQLSGRAAVADRLSKLCPDINKDSLVVETVLEKIKIAESEGYQYDNCDASLTLLMLGALGRRKSFFELLDFKIVLSDPSKNETLTAALIKICVDGNTALVAAEGIGPVNAMDKALRSALERFYPELRKTRLIDYRVRVIDSADATAAKVRVVIDTSDGNSSWRTVGVSRDIIEASWIALCESFEYKLSENDINI